MVSVQDHKRALDGDQGPNTGGMGTVSPCHQPQPRRPQADHAGDRAARPIGGLAAEGRRYQGVLYAGLMITDAGPKVLEFNARFGDPETQVIMARMRSDIVPILQRRGRGPARATRRSSGPRSRRSAWCWRAKGYPDDARRPARRSSGLDALEEESDVVVYHAATAQKDGEVVTVRRARARGDRASAPNLDAA